MRPRRRRLLGGALLLLSVPLGLGSLAVGWTFDGRDPPVIQCSRGPYPDAGGPFHEATRVTGEVSLLPVGVDCTYDVDGDGLGVQTIHHHDVPATVGLVVSVLAFGSGGLLLLVGDRHGPTPVHRSAADRFRGPDAPPWSRDADRVEGSARTRSR